MIKILKKVDSQPIPDLEVDENKKNKEKNSKNLFY